MTLRSLKESLPESLEDGDRWPAALAAGWARPQTRSSLPPSLWLLLVLKPLGGLKERENLAQYTPECQELLIHCL